MDRRLISGLLAAVVVVGGAVMLLPGEKHATTVASVLAEEGVRVTGAANMNITGVDEETVAGIRMDQVSAEEDDRRLEIRVLKDIEETFASRYIEDRVKDITGRFVQREAPYAAVPVPEVNCTTGFTPTVSRQPNDDRNKTIISLYADKNREYTCLRDTAAYRAGIVMLYCPSARTVAEFSFFVPYDRQWNVSEEASSISCAG